MILIHLYGILLFLYVTFRLILPAPLSHGGKALAVALVFLASQFHLCIRLLFGSLSSPELPYPLLLGLSYAFVALTLIFALLLLRDLVFLGCFLRAGSRRQPGFPFRLAAGPWCSLAWG
jgi:hypothetical protein